MVTPVHTIRVAMEEDNYFSTGAVSLTHDALEAELSLHGSSVCRFQATVLGDDQTRGETLLLKSTPIGRQSALFLRKFYADVTARADRPAVWTGLPDQVHRHTHVRQPKSCEPHDTPRTRVVDGCPSSHLRLQAVRESSSADARCTHQKLRHCGAVIQFHEPYAISALVSRAGAVVSTRHISLFFRTCPSSGTNGRCSRSHVDSYRMAFGLVHRNYPRCLRRKDDRNLRSNVTWTFRSCVFTETVFPVAARTGKRTALRDRSVPLW